MKLRYILLTSAAAFTLVACGAKDTTANVETEVSEIAQEGDDGLTHITVTAEELEGNPFLENWDGEFGVPPFASISDEHYLPAIKNGILKMRAEVDAIVSNDEPPTFENTVVALDTAGEDLSKVLGVFFNITSTDTNDTLRAIETEVAPMLSAERNAVNFNPDLFARIKAVYENQDQLGLDEQDARLLELTYRDFVRNGADLDAETKAEVGKINEELSSLTTKFGQNLLRATKAFKIEVTDEAELAGLSEDLKTAIKVDGEDKWILTVDRSVYEAFMTQSENRDLRQQMFDGYRLRANSGEFDNGPILIKIAQLRAKRAELMGYESHAHYQLETRMARTPQAAEEFLMRVLKPGLEKAKAERDEMEAMIDGAFDFEGYDWWHWSEKVRAANYAFDESQLAPYFELEAVRKGSFDVAEKLFNVSFTEKGIEGWHPLVKSFEVTDNETGEHIGLFMADMYARDSKRGGAWMSGFRSASNVDENIRPIVTNNLNLIKPPEGQPTLMPFSSVETLFHEFGHGLHGLLTTARYQRFSGVDGPRDYTEFPAQLLEHWAGDAEVLAEFAKHHETGEPIPMELIEKMNAAKNYNQGFATTEFIAASLLDLNWHMLSSEEAAKITDARAFEKEVLEKYGIIEDIEPRYRSQYFSHIFAGGYSAGYYAYLWSEILDSDGFEAFKETGDIYNPELAAKLKRWVYEAGGLREADELYRNFRGADPSIEPLLKNRGFPTDEEPAEG